MSAISLALLYNIRQVRHRLALRDWSSREHATFLQFPRAMSAFPRPSRPSTIRHRRSGSKATSTPCARRRSPSSDRAPRRRTRSKWRAGWAPISRAAMSPWSAAWRAASIRRRIAARSKAAASRSRCSAAASTSSIRPSIAALAERIVERGALVSEFPPGTPPLKAQLSAAQSHHQRPVARGRRRRGGGRQRLADHRRLRARAGARRARGARQRAGRAQLRRARAPARRCKACGVCGRYLGGAASRDQGLGIRD